jgi:hypothetical protein
MATWVDPIDSQTDPDAPLTSEIGKRWDNNVIAAFEGADGAPRLSPKAKGYKSIAGSAASNLTLAGMSGYLGAVIHVYHHNIAGAGAPMDISISDDGVSFGATFTVATVGANSVGSTTVTINFADGSVDAVSSGTGAVGYASGSVGVPAGAVSHIRISAAGASTTTIAAMALVNGGDTA